MINVIWLTREESANLLDLPWIIKEDEEEGLSGRKYLMNIVEDDERWMRQKDDLFPGFYYSHFLNYNGKQFKIGVQISNSSEYKENVDNIIEHLEQWL